MMTMMRSRRIEHSESQIISGSVLKINHWALLFLCCLCSQADLPVNSQIPKVLQPFRKETVLFDSLAEVLRLSLNV